MLLLGGCWPQKAQTNNEEDGGNAGPFAPEKDAKNKPNALREERRGAEGARAVAPDCACIARAHVLLQQGKPGAGGLEKQYAHNPREGWNGG